MFYLRTGFILDEDGLLCAKQIFIFFDTLYEASVDVSFYEYLLGFVSSASRFLTHEFAQFVAQFLNTVSVKRCVILKLSSSFCKTFKYNFRKGYERKIAESILCPNFCAIVDQLRAEVCII